MLEIRKAVRRSGPLQIAFVGPSGSGKTLSAILFAAGLLKAGQRLLVIDTERRAHLYADNPRVMAALPDGFDILELGAPFEPLRFIEAIELVENAGKYGVCCIDSHSAVWSASGGMEDMKAKSGQWLKPKKDNKKLMMRIVNSNMHFLLCLQSEEKTKIIEVFDAKKGKNVQEYIPLGFQPIMEKNTFFPLLLAFEFEPKTHLATVIKANEGIDRNFPTQGWLITKEDGVRVRTWNEGGAALDPHEQIINRSRVAAEDGSEAYKSFYSSLTPVQKKAILDTCHADNKKAAEEADRMRFAEPQEAAGDVPSFGTADNPAEWPETFEGPWLRWNGVLYFYDMEDGQYKKEKA